MGSWFLVSKPPRDWSNIILWNFQGWSFVFSEISRGKVKKERKIPGVFQKKVCPQPSCFFFWNSPVQVGSVAHDQKCSCKWNLSFFKAVSPNRLPSYLGSLVHIISSLFSHFRSWDYPENFGIYSQLDRKSKTWFFTFLNVYVSWTEQGKILISQLSLQKYRFFADQNGPNGDPMKMNIGNFQIQKRGS